jgi:hypothetical protein
MFILQNFELDKIMTTPAFNVNKNIFDQWDSFMRFRRFFFISNGSFYSKIVNAQQSLDWPVLVSRLAMLNFLSFPFNSITIKEI